MNHWSNIYVIYKVKGRSKLNRFFSLFVCLVIFATGYVSNIIKLTRCDFEAPYKAEVIRTIGLLPPVGVIIGYVTIEDGKK